MVNKAKVTLSTTAFLVFVAYAMVMYMKVTHKITIATVYKSIIREVASPTVDWENSSLLENLAPEILNEHRPPFLPHFKNPCWTNETNNMLNCLPYFYLAGMPKCGTTDLWEKIVQHPLIANLIFKNEKEPHWWTRKRIGQYSREAGKTYPTSYYYERWSKNLKRTSKRTGISKTKLIVGDGSASTLWDNHFWREIYPDHKEGPPHVIAEVISAVQPKAKIIVVLRDPVERLFSDYLFFVTPNDTTISATDFHDRVVKSLTDWTTCLRVYGTRTCTYSYNFKIYGYNGSTSTRTRLQLGLYSVYISDWLKVYPKDQMLILRMEDWHVDCQSILKDIYQFLDLHPLTMGQLDQICRDPKANSRSPEKERIGPMKSITRELLEQFYEPFNKNLTDLLRDDKYLWR